MITREDVRSKVKEAVVSYAEDKFGKGKKNGKRSKHRRGSRGGKQTLFNRGQKFNDVGYYTRNKSITDAFCNIPFSWLVGNPLVNLQEDLTVKIPAIVSYMIDWVTSLGTYVGLASDYTSDEDILDQVATIIYSQMRRSNSGSTNGVEHVDVLISNLIASIDICVNVHYVHRIFKVANSFSWRNRLIPKYIFEHHFGIDYEDFIAHQANYRGEFNTIVALARTIRTLADFPFINAIMDEFDNIFKDSDTDNGREQLIVSVKPVHHIYDPVGTESAPGGCVRLMKVGDIHDYMDDDVNKRLVWTGVPKENTGSDYVHLKFSVLLDIIRAQINALITDNDFNLIQADIEKAFGEQSGYIVVDPISDTSVLTPVYSGEFNLMFKNGKFNKHGYDIDNNWEFDVMNDFRGNPFTTLMPNAIVNTIYQVKDEQAGNTKLKVALFWLAPSGDAAPTINNLLNLLNMEADNPTTDDVIIATRFKHTSEIIYGAELINAGIPSEFVINAGAPFKVPQNCSNFVCFGGNVTYVETTKDKAIVRFTQWSNTTANAPTLLLGLEHPPMYLNFNLILNDNINNLRGLDASELYSIQKSCFLSLWNLPNKTNL